MDLGDCEKHYFIAYHGPTPTIEALLSDTRQPALDIHRELLAVPDSVRAARQLVAALMQELTLDDERHDDVLLAVSEAVTNAVRHAYDTNRGRIDLTIQRSAGRLAITISDRGRGLHSPTPDPGLGLGVGLIRQTADHAVFMSNRHGGTTVEMRFTLTA